MPHHILLPPESAPIPKARPKSVLVHLARRAGVTEERLQSILLEGRDPGRGDGWFAWTVLEAIDEAGERARSSTP